MVTRVTPAAVNVEQLRENIREKYVEVATTPEKGFHFHTGAPLAGMLGYPDEAVEALPAPTVDSFAGTGNPFTMGVLGQGETVLDIGCGAGFDTLQAAQQVGPAGRVIAVDMTPEMLARAEKGAAALSLRNIEFRRGYAEDLPVETGSVDVVISNGVINLCPDKMAVMREINRVLKPGGRVQIADIVVQREVDQSAKDDIDLWSG